MSDQPKTLTRGPDGSPSTMRHIAMIAVYAGVFTLVAGVVLAFVESIGKTGTANGQVIALAGLGSIVGGTGGKAWQAQAEYRRPIPPGPNGGGE